MELATDSNNYYPTQAQNICINCSEPLLTPSHHPQEGTRNPEIAVYELKQENSEILQASLFLERLYRLNYLKDVFFEESLEEKSALCPSCADSLHKLYQLYGAFEKVRKFDSFLWRKIDRLDTLIRQHGKNFDVGGEAQSDTQNVLEVEILELDQAEHWSDREITPEPSESLKEIKKEVKHEPVKAVKRKRVEKVETSSTVPKTGPWVLLKRLKKTEIPEASSGKGPEVSIEETNDFSAQEEPESDFNEASAMSNFSEDDEFESGSKKKRFKMKLKAKDKSKKKKKINEKKPPINKFGKGFYREFYSRKQLHPFPCVYCEEDFDEEKDRFEHLKEKHSDLLGVICPPCGRIFPTAASKTAHEPKCGAVPPNFHLPPYICKSCGKEFKTWFYMTSHEKQVHIGARRFACDECDYTAKLGSTLRQHKKLVHEVHERAVCSECGKTFKNQFTLELHFRNLHTEAGREAYMRYERKSLERRRKRNAERRAQATSVCSECGIDFRTIQRFRYHFNEVHAEKKFTCEDCGKGFTKLDILKAHKKSTHTDERPFVCEICGKSYKTSKHVRAHVRGVHTEEGRRKNNEYHRECRRQKMALGEVLAKKQEFEQSVPLDFETIEGFGGVEESAGML